MKHINIITVLVCLTLLSACDKSATEHNLSRNNPHDLTALADELSQHTNNTTDTPDIQPIITPDGKIKIDLSHIKTAQPKADLASYDYPIALDTQAVKNYAKAHHITDKQAQHSLVIGMASPEVLGKVLDQLKDGKYLGHRLTDGADMTLIISTTPDVVADSFDYVFADNFGKGLVLPVVIKPAPPKE